MFTSSHRDHVAGTHVHKDANMGTHAPHTQPHTWEAKIAKSIGSIKSIWTKH